MKALFGQDPEIHIDFNDEDDELIMRVDNPTKAAALEELLPDAVEFGDVVLYITVVPGNATYTKADLFRIAFTGNPAFSFMETVNDETFSFPANYCVFKNEVVQFPADDLSSYYGVKSTLYEDIAEEVFDDMHDGIYFCTDLPESEKFF
jgi:hypothetical protein